MHCFLIYSGERQTLSMKCNKFGKCTHCFFMYSKTFLAQAVIVFNLFFWKGLNDRKTHEGQVQTRAAESAPDLPRNMNVENNPTKIHRDVFIAQGFIHNYLQQKESFTP